MCLLCTAHAWPLRLACVNVIQRNRMNFCPLMDCMDLPPRVTPTYSLQQQKTLRDHRCDSPIWQHATVARDLEGLVHVAYAALPVVPPWRSCPIASGMANRRCYSSSSSGFELKIRKRRIATRKMLMSALGMFREQVGRGDPKPQCGGMTHTSSKHV